LKKEDYVKAIYKNIDSIMIIYNVNSKISYENLEKILDFINLVREKEKNLSKILIVGSVFDSNIRREVTYLEGNYFANKNNFEFIEVIKDDKINSNLEKLLCLLLKGNIKNFKDFDNHKDINFYYNTTI
jgi:hypothetical protein